MTHDALELLFRFLCCARGARLFVLFAGVSVGACGGAGTLDVEVIVGSGSVLVFVMDRGLNCSCSDRVLEEGECDTYSDVPSGCSCESEPSDCEVEVRLLRGASELFASQGRVPMSDQLYARGAIDGTEVLEVSGCGVHAMIDVPPPLRVTASFTVSARSEDVVVDWSSDTDVDRINVWCGGPFAGNVCGRAAESPATISRTLCDPADDVNWGVALFDTVPVEYPRLGTVEIWRIATADWLR